MFHLLYECILCVLSVDSVVTSSICVLVSLPISSSTPLRLFVIYALTEQSNDKNVTTVCCWNSTASKIKKWKGKCDISKARSKQQILFIISRGKQSTDNAGTVKISRLTISTKWNDRKCAPFIEDSFTARRGCTRLIQMQAYFCFSFNNSFILCAFFLYPNEFPFVNSLSTFFPPFCTCFSLCRPFSFFSLRYNYFGDITILTFR